MDRVLWNDLFAELSIPSNKVDRHRRKGIEYITSDFCAELFDFFLLRSGDPVDRLRAVQVGEVDENMIMKRVYFGTAYRVDAEAS